MRRLANALTVTVLSTTLVLAGCSSSGDGEATPAPSPSTSAADDAAPTASAEDVAALEAVTVEGEPGAKPTLTFDQPFDVSAPLARVETPGTGATIEAGQKLTMQYLVASGEDGSEQETTWGSDTPMLIVLDETQLPPQLIEILAGEKVGARVLFAAPGRAAVEATDSAPAVEAVPASVIVLDVLDAVSVPTRAEGEAVAPPAGLPVVTLAEDGEPSIEIPAGTVEPTTLVVQPLIKGAGPEVQTGQQVTVQYSGWLFDGTPFDSSWENGAPFPTQIGTGSVITGWDHGLVGQTVGSQVLLVVPPDLAYGDTARGTIPANSTLIFVVDILDAA